MTKAEFGIIVQHVQTQMESVLESAGKEYAAEDNVFANFERSATDLNLERDEILWVYAMKHRDGIASYLRGHRSQREDVRGRIIDLINYLTLLYAMVEEVSLTATVATPDDSLEGGVVYTKGTR